MYQNLPKILSPSHSYLKAHEFTLSITTATVDNSTQLVLNQLLKGTSYSIFISLINLSTMQGTIRIATKINAKD